MTPTSPHISFATFWTSVFFSKKRERRKELLDNHQEWKNTVVVVVKGGRGMMEEREKRKGGLALNIILRAFLQNSSRKVIDKSRIITDAEIVVESAACGLETGYGGYCLRGGRKGEKRLVITKRALTVC